MSVRSCARRRSSHALRPVHAIEALEDRRLLAGAPVISEFLASNDDSLRDSDNQLSDWIEIFNAGDEPVDLAGWHLTDDPNNLDRWTFPSTVIAPGDFLVVFASGKNRTISGEELHTNFGLDAAGDYLALVAPDGATIASQYGSADRSFPQQQSDVSYGIRDTGQESELLIETNDTASYLVPVNNDLGTAWTDPEFDDSAWNSGSGPLGFDGTGDDTGGSAVRPLTEYAWHVLSDNPRFYWNFDESDGAAMDLVRGQANDSLVPTNGATRTDHDSLATGLRLGRTATLDGTSSFAAAGVGDVQMPGAWAIEFWMQATGSQVTPVGSSGFRNDYLINFGAAGTTGGDNPSVMFDQSAATADNKVELYRGVRTAANGPTIGDAGWHHVVLAFYGNGTSIGVANRTDIAIDGVVTTNITDNNFSSVMSLAQGIVVGARYADGTSGFEGNIDELALYDLSGMAVGEIASKIGELAGHHALAATTATTSSLQCVIPASYTYNIAPGGNAAYADAQLSKLNDGVVGSTETANYAAGQWAGWNTIDPVITLDLGHSYVIDAISIDYAVAHGPGVHAPDSVTITYSADGVNFASPVDFDSFNDSAGPGSSGWARRAVINVPTQSARYVRLAFANADPWTFLSELRVTGSRPGEAGRNCMVDAPVELPSLVGYWSFDDESTDLSGNGNHVTLEGATYHDDVPPEIGAGKSLNFEAAQGQFAEVADAAELRLSDAFTISAWMRSTNANQTQTYVISRNTAYANPYGAPSKQYAVIYEYVDNRVEFFGPSRLSGSDPRPGSQMLIPDTNWHHIAYSYDGSVWSGYVDGQRVFAQDLSFALDDTFASSWFFGTANPDVGFFNGRLDDIAMWDQSLSSAQIEALSQGASPLSVVGYGPLLGTNVGPEMRDVNASIYTRYEFDVDDPDDWATLQLRMQYDDGFVAYLNGTPVAQDNAPATATWNSSASGPRDNADAVTFRSFDLSSHLDALRSGTNVLAIQGLNAAADDSDLLLSAELRGTRRFEVLGYNTFFLTPSPGTPNGGGIGEPGPEIDSVSVASDAIDDDDDVIVTAVIRDTLAATSQVKLHYRVNYGAHVELDMVDDGSGADTVAGDGVFTTTIPHTAASPGQMLRYFVTAIDQQQRTTRYPRFLDPTGSPEYVGTVVRDPAVVTELPVLQWFLEPGTEAAADTRSGTRAAVFYRDTLYDNIFVRLRGRSINTTGKLAYKLDFNQHHHFVYDPTQPAVEEVDLGSTGLDKSYVRPVLGFGLLRDVGADYSTTFPMRVQRNGQFFSVAWFIENPDAEYLARNGLDPEGAFYKANLNGFTTAAQGGYRSVYEGWDKKTRLWEDNSDIVEFTAGVELTGSALKNFLFDNVDIAAQINYMAAEVLLQDADRLVNNFYVYRDTNDTGLWHMITWDLDLSQGQFSVGSDTFHANDDYPAGVSHPFHGIQSKPDFRNPSLWNNLLTKFVQIPELREMFLRRLRTMMDEFLMPTGTPEEELYFESKMESLFDQMESDVLLDKSRWGNRYGAIETFRQSLDRLRNEYFAQRRTHLFETHSVDNAGSGDVDVLISGTPGEVIASYFVPTSNALGTTWTTRSFSPAVPWATGSQGIGFESAPADYAALIETPVNPSAACATCTSIYVRIPFEVDDPGTISQLTLRMKYDDGFVAYLNGQEVARRGVSGTPGFDSVAANHDDASAVVFEDMAISSASLVAGENVLAIHAMNAGATSSDMLVLAELLDGVPLNTDVAGIPHAQIGLPQIVFDASSYDANPASGNQDQEYLKLDNPLTTAVDISGWRLSGGIEHLFPAGTVIPAGQSLYLTPSVAAFRARTTGPAGGQGLFVQGNYDGHLSNFGETVRLLGPEGTEVDQLEIAPDVSLVQEYLRISELMYHPADALGAEFIELTNISQGDAAVTLDLSGVAIASGPSEPFVFPAGTRLAPGSFLLVVQDLAQFQTAYPAVDSAIIAGVYQGSFSNGGERVRVDDATGSTVMDFDYEDGGLWPARADGVGASLVFDPTASRAAFDHPSSWRGSVEFGGSPGLPGQQPIGVVINEVLSNSSEGLVSGDAIELHNTTAAAINISGWYLSDSSQSLLKYRIPAGTILPPDGYYVVDERSFNPTPTDPQPTHFALNGDEGDDVWLVIASTTGTLQAFVDDVRFGATMTDTSLGRSSDGSGLLSPRIGATLGCANALVTTGTLVISEVQYHPANPSPEALQLYPEMTEDDLEYVEIYHSTGDVLDLGAWRLRGGVDFDFPGGVELAPGATMTIVSFNPLAPGNANRIAAFRAHYGLTGDVTLMGGYSGQLSDNTEAVRLEQRGVTDPAEPEIIPWITLDSLVYADLAPWPTGADGAGASLQRRLPAGDAALAELWRAATPTPGTAVFDNPVAGDVTGDGEVDGDDITALQHAISMGHANSLFDLDRNGTLDSADRDYLLTTILNTLPGDANLDGQVDAQDFNAWNSHRFQSCFTSWQDGDFNGDGSADGSDFNLWLRERFVAQPAQQAGRPRPPRAPLADQPVPAAIDATFAVLDKTLRSAQRRRASESFALRNMARRHFDFPRHSHRWGYGELLGMERPQLPEVDLP